jgi:hypothetical protein
MNKRQIAGSAIVFGLPKKDMFHWVEIKEGVYKVEMKFVLIPRAPLPFPHHGDDSLQLCLKQMINQFALWGGGGGGGKKNF